MENGNWHLSVDGNRASRCMSFSRGTALAVSSQQMERFMSSLVPWALALFASGASACGSCTPLVLARIAETSSASFLLALLAPVIVLAAVALAVQLAQRP